MRSLYTSIKITIAFCIILFCGYVLVLWGIAAIATPNHGEVAVVKNNGITVGAANIGQKFTSKAYFWSRPSAVDYDSSKSGGSNKGPSNETYLKEVSARTDQFLKDHPYLSRNEVPSDMVTASGSGLDPDISVEGANVQVKRVAMARGLSEATVKSILNDNTERPVIGRPIVNVLKLNIALDYYSKNDKKDSNTEMK